MLLGGHIVESKVNKDISQFDRIFNSLPLGSEKLTADNTELDLSKADYKEGDHEKFIINCLKRALGINESLLAEVSKFIYGKKQNFTCNIESLSLFYRSILIARVNNITVNTLIMLFSLLPEVFKSNIQSCGSSDNIYDLLYDVNYYTTWFNENKLSISMCYLLLRNGDEVVVSQGVRDLVSEIKNGLNKGDFNDKPSNADELIKKISPALSSVLDISSVNAMESVLLWVNILKPEGIDIKTLFSNVCDKDKIPEKKENKTIIFIIKMSVMINMIAIDDSLLSLWIQDPACLDISFDIRKYKFSVIKMMMDANAVIKRTGEKSDLVISSLNDGELSYKIIADIFGQDNKIVRQAFDFFDKIESISNYRLLIDVMMILDLFKETDVSPDDFTKLFCNDKKDKVYDDYLNISKIAESTLEPDEIIELKCIINKRRSPALCSLYIIEKLHGLRHENYNAVVYKKLLIDTEISEGIKTTRIAEAIAAIQLYVNNCLNNIEKEVRDSVRTRPFFRNWEEYNRRYSTWAALSMLVYYPENYVDPVIRSGETAMMDKLQQLISRDGINKEAIDNAFCSYLTAFEKIANLNVISAYHDNLDIKKGKTYFIGHSVFSKNNYYIRSVNHEGVGKEVNNSTMPSLVWSGWEKISCGLNPYMDTIRPVIFNGRLYIVWLELTSIKLPKDEKDNGSKAAENEIVKYEAKLFFSYLSFDNLWSEPDYIDLSSKAKSIILLTSSVGGISGLSFYCSNNIKNGDLYCLFYDKNDKTKNEVALRLSGEYMEKDLSNDEKTLFIDRVEKYKDKAQERKVVNIYSGDVADIIHDSSDDMFYQYTPGLSIDSVFIKNTGGGFDSVNKQYNLGFNFNFLLNKTLVSYDDRYPVHIQLCKSLGWTNDNIYHSMAYLNERIYTDDGYVIDSVVFIFNKKQKKYVLFLYDSEEKKIISLKQDYFYYLTIFLKQNNQIVSSYDVKRMQSGKVPDIVFVGSDPILSLISDKSSSVYFELQCESGRYYTFKARLAIFLFLGNFNFVSIKARSTLNNESKEYPESDWVQSKDNIGTDGVKYISKDNAYSVSFKSGDVDNYRDKKINFDLVVLYDSVEVCKYSLSCYIGLFDSAHNIIGIKSNKNKAQYLEFKNEDGAVRSRIRLNTLFANKLVSMANKGVDNVLLLHNQGFIEPDINSDDDVNKFQMDFNGANALYFWEMFYYVPMMIADILLQHQSYNEAERWLQYIFNPAGYIENDTYTDRYWNVRPLEEDKKWNELLPDDTDPDAIALADPMHYKMATFMKTLELLIARGDKAYRELERDSLNEAKSWYIQALSLLGEEPVTLLNKDWSSPKLADAADKTVQSTIQHLLMRINTTGDSSAISVNSANTLTKVFKPQLNEKLIACRETINQRIFNLRNGLSINGQRLYLPIFSSLADPRNMLESQVNNISSEKTLINKKTLMYRFPVVIENAKSLVSQLIEFGDKLLGFNERRDDEQFSELLIHQGNDLLTQSIRIQDAEIKNLQAEKVSLLSQQREIIHRAEHYEALHSEYILPEEAGAIVLNTLAAGLSGQSRVIKGLGMLADLAPNIFGVAAGGSDWSAGTDCASELLGGAAETMQGLAYPLEKGAEYRRRAQEWQLESESAREEEKQIAAELEAMDIQITAAKMQRHYIVTEQRQNQQQLQFLQRKFTRAELYGWLRGRLMAIYSPFYDLVVSRCFMAEDAYRYEMNVNAADRSFINTSAWKGAYSGLMAGESLMLNLAQLEEAYLEKDKRVLEVTRTVSLAEVYSSDKMSNNKFSFAGVTALVSEGRPGKLGNQNNYVELLPTVEQTNRMELDAVIKLDELGIYTDYPKNLGVHRLIMQISVTLPALIEPYQNVRALLEYVTDAKDEKLPEGCKSIAVSHGMNDSGLFHLQFGDSTYLPFEGLSVKGQGHFKLRFFDVGDGDQKRLLQTLTDIVLHIRYTIY